MRILVTGATGFIGRFLLPHLIQQPEITLSILVRETYGQAGTQPLPAEIQAIRDQIHVVYADLRNFRLTVRAIKTAVPDCVIHLAAAGVTDPFLGVDTALRHNLYGTIHLLRACFERTHTTRQFIVARTPGELSSLNVYAASKAAAWNFCQMYGRTHQWPIHGAMIYQAYGPGQSERNLVPAAITAALAGQDFPMTVGAQKRDWIYQSDVATGLQAMIDSDLPPAATVELGSGRTTSVADVVHTIYTLANRGGKPLVGVLPGRPGEENIQVADAAKTQQLLGWQTAVSLTEGLRHMINMQMSY